MEISVVLLVTRLTEADHCLKSLEAQTFEGEREAVIVTSPELSARIPETGLKIRIIPEADINPAVRRNIGWRSSSAPVIAFIDDDLICDKEWLKNACSYLDVHPEISVLGGPDKLMPGASFGEEVSDYLLRTPFIGSGVIAHEGSKKDREIFSPSHLPLCNLFIRRELLEKIDGFNEKIHYVGEDTEMLFHAKKRYGARFYYKADAVVYHKRREFPVPFIKQRFFYRKKNGFLFFAYPEIYLLNPKFLIFFSLFTSGFAVLFLNSPLFLKLMVLYFFFVWILTFRYYSKKWKLLPVLTFAFPLHHLTYYFGLWAGILYGLFHMKEARSMRR